MREFVASWRRLLSHLRFVWCAAPFLVAACLVLSVLQAGAALAIMVCSSQLIASVAARASNPDAASLIGPWLVGTAAALIAGPLLAAAAAGLEELARARYLGAFQDLLLDTATRPYLLTEVRTPAAAAVLDGAAAALHHWLFIRGIGGIWGALGPRLAATGALIVFLGWRWYIGIGLLAIWLWVSHVVARWRRVVFDDTEQRAVPLRRRAAYLFNLAASRPTAKEVRLFGLAGWLVDGFARLTTQAMALVATRRSAAVRGTVLPLIALLLAHLVALGVLTVDIVEGTLTIAALTLILQATIVLSAFGQQDDAETALGRTVTEFSRLADLRAALGLPFLAPSPGVPVPPPPAGGPAEVAVTGLSFAYPGSPPVLADMNLEIDPGECVAIVGPNGAGKSTLLALLGGLWQPDTGRVHIDGLDPATTPQARARVAPIMQDFARFPLSAAENINAGHRWLPGADWSAPAKAAGADQVIAGLSQKAATVLSPEFTGGTDLSGGQWQRIALARTMAAVASGAGLLVLDEPASALDTRAETALFEKVLELRGRTTTILITHRLASVRRADRIFVLDTPTGSTGARIIESGTHTELIALGGTYAAMFTLQAQRFQAEEQLA